MRSAANHKMKCGRGAEAHEYRQAEGCPVTISRLVDPALVVL